MPDSLPRKADVYFIQQILKPNWDETLTNGYTIAVDSGPELIKSADSFDQLGEYYPQFTIQAQGEPSNTETGYDFLTNDGPGQNRLGTLTAQVRVEKTDDGYTPDSNTYDAVDGDRLATLIRQEIERICSDNATGADSLFYFCSANTDGADNQTGDTQTVYIESSTIAYGWIRE